MNRQEYLMQVEKELDSIPLEERNAALNYYREFFDDAGPENEQAVIASLGNPSDLAKAIISEGGFDKPQEDNAPQPTFTPPKTQQQINSKAQGKSPNWLLIFFLLIITFPLWIGIVGAIFGLLVGLLGIAFGLTVGLIGAAVGLLAWAVHSLFVNPLLAIVLFGIALIAIGLVMLVGIPIFKIAIKVISAVCKGIGSLFNGFFGRKGA